MSTVIIIFNSFAARNNLSTRNTLKILIPIIIEALGDYWHGNPIKYNDSNMSDIQRKNKNKDKARFAYLNKCGYNIFGIWENDVNTDIEKAMKPVMDCIRTLETDITDTLTRV
jgi:G:T-mismatch repair DNA endonuclease (very short patch repair protein)